MNPCLICYQIRNQVPGDVMLDRFGATAIWEAQKEHDEEQHEEVVKVE